MDESIRRLLAPRSVALIGGAWTDPVAAGCRTIGYRGEVWRIHPSRPSSPGEHYYRSVADLPGAPDAAFIAVPKHEAVAVASALRTRGAGGFVCFASGFSETGSSEGEQLTVQLQQSAGTLPYLGPNCYGFVNYFDRVALWPDQVVGESPERGVALICQSGTIALTLMFNERSLPIGYLFSVGNQTRLAVEDLIELLVPEERVSAFGVYVEGIKNAPRLLRAAALARAAGKPIALIKSGRTAAAARTALSHTGALAGADAVFDAFCRQAGIARCATLGSLCETLKLLHCGGPLAGRRVLVMGASGGDMAMTADVAQPLGLSFPPPSADTSAKLRQLLGDRVTIANPFDFHTYVWFDWPAMRALFSTALRAGYDAVGFVLDSPPEATAGAAAFVAAIEQFIAAAAGAPARAVLISSLPETISPTMRRRCLQTGVVPLQGQREALEALNMAGAVGECWRSGTVLALALPAGTAGTHSRNLSEPEGKAALVRCGVPVPGSRTVPVAAAGAAAAALGFPVVIKAVSAELAHKSEAGGVVLNVRTRPEAEAAAKRLGALSATLLVEEMIDDGVLEVLVGMVVDPQFGLTLVLGAGGLLTELLQDSVSLLPPFTAATIGSALQQLKLAPLLQGFRGRPPADVAALVELILAVTRFATSRVDTLVELDVNPVIVRPVGKGAVAVDAMIRLRSE
jgi:acyl-CoA synthetase (NDP forming)